MHYVLIANVPGFLPEGEPVEFQSRGDALQGLRDEIISGADRLADVYGADHELVAEWDAAADAVGDDEIAGAPSYIRNVASVCLPMSDSPHDLGITFAVEPLGL